MIDEAFLGERDAPGDRVPDVRPDFGPLFAKPTGRLRTSDTHGCAQCPHHRLSDVDDSEGAVPPDRWFGSFHDGSHDAAAGRRARPIAARV